MTDLVSTRFDENDLLSVAFETDEAGEIVFSRELFCEFRELLERIPSAGRWKGIILRVGSAGSDVTPYPIAELLAKDQNEIRRSCFEAQDTMKLLRSLEIPSCCLMEGAIAGPALELALACDTRIMSLEGGSCIRFPEIGIGILPPLGGVFTMIGLIGLAKVLGLIENRVTLTPSEALEAGLVDHLTRADMMEQCAGMVFGQIIVPPQDADPAGPESLMSLLTRLWADNRARKLFTLSSASRRASQILRPGMREAFLGVIEMIREGLSSGVEEGLMVAARNFTDLVSSPTNRNLLSLAQKDAQIRRWVKSVTVSIEREGEVVTILGDSKRAVDWTVLFASKGHAVRLIARDIRSVSRLLKERFHPAGEALRRIFPSTHSRGMRSSGLVIAAGASHDIEELGRFVGEATGNTSSSVPVAIDTASLPFLVSEIPLESKHRVYGMARWGSTDGSEVIEVSLRDNIHVEGLPELLSHLAALDPLTVIVRESPAGLCKRVIAAYLTEALRLMEEGAGILRVEEAALASGLSMGPFLTLDVHGLEDYLETAGFLRSRIGERFRAPEIAVKLLEMGVEGQHGKRGFYVHTDGRPWLDENLSPSEATQVHSPRYDEVIQERLLLSIIGEAVRIFGEGISLHPEIIDCALVSIGMFPAHLGGPLHHAALLGIPKLLRRFEKMYGTWGVQFEPPEFLSTSLGEKTLSSFAAGERV